MCFGASEGASGSSALRRASSPHGPSPWLGSGPRHIRAERYAKCHYRESRCCIFLLHLGIEELAIHNRRDKLALKQLHDQSRYPQLHRLPQLLSCSGTLPLCYPDTGHYPGSLMPFFALIYSVLPCIHDVGLSVALRKLYPITDLSHSGGA